MQLRHEIIICLMIAVHHILNLFRSSNQAQKKLTDCLQARWHGPLQRDAGR